MKFIKKAVLFILPVFLFSCAASYKPIYPPKLNYSAHRLDDGISFSYKYDVLSEKGNRKYSRKEEIKRIKLVAVKITNNTDSILKIGQDIQFYSGSNQLIPMDPNTVKHEVKQYTFSYMLYLLLTPLKLYVSDGYNVETYSIGYGLGPGISLINMAIAGNANSEFSKELTEYSIVGVDLEKGETIYGMIGFKDMGYDPIKIKVNENIYSANADF
ncbi:hypothetical protein ACFLSE_02755 [Bacteroidota bacterium]